MTALIIILYLIGCVVSYILFKRLISDNGNDDWTIGDRTWGLMFSILSWVMVLISLVILIIISTDNKKPAKW